MVCSARLAALSGNTLGRRLAEVSAGFCTADGRTDDGRFLDIGFNLQDEAGTLRAASTSVRIRWRRRSFRFRHFWNLARSPFLCDMCASNLGKSTLRVVLGRRFANSVRPVARAR